MALRLRRPNQSDMERLLAASRDTSLTYSPIGGSLDGAVPRRLRRRRWSVCLPSDAFERAASLIFDWSVHRGAGLTVIADGAIATGTNVAMSAPLPVGFVDITCRVVTVIADTDRRGFAYGTLPVHPETGEEAFIVVRDEGGVRFDVQAVSAPRHPLARLAPPLANRLQDTAVQRYLSAMTALVGESPQRSG